MAPTSQSQPPPPPPPVPGRRAGPPPGLKNLGNTCYLNSVLQCLASTPPLASFCLSSRHSNLCKKIFPSREKECAFCVLERLIARLLRPDAGALDAPGKIIRCLSLFSENFRLGRQEDAHEFLRYVIDACHTAGLRIRKRLPSANTNGSGDEEHGEGPSMVMKEIFGGALLSQVKCLSCKGESNKTDEIMDISLDLPGSNSIGDALSRFFQPEVLDGTNKYSCGRCKKLTPARKQMFVLRAPNVLVIQLKRFEGIHGGKINRSIEFKEVLLLSEFMYDVNQDSEPEYNLFGCIVHSGFSPESGHYYAYIKDASGRWYCCNDAHVSLSSSQEVLSEKVYILFYIRNMKSQKCSTNGYSCSAVKSCSTNGNGISPNVKASELPKAALMKQNGSCSTRSDMPVLLKNGKIAPSPQLKPIYIKNVDIEKVANGKDNIDIRNNLGVKTTVKSVESDAKDGAEHSSRNAHGATCSNKMDVDSLKTVPSANGNGHPINSHEVQEISGAKVMTCTEQNSELSSSCAFASTLEREPPNLGNAKNSVLQSEESESSLKNNVPSKVEGTCSMHSVEEANFKEMLGKRASSELRSSGWVDDVYNFMRAEKRRRIQDHDRCLDSDAIRRQLITDSGRIFRSKIPESLREYLIRLDAHFRGDCIIFLFGNCNILVPLRIFLVSNELFLRLFLKDIFISWQRLSVHTTMTHHINSAAWYARSLSCAGYINVDNSPTL